MTGSPADESRLVDLLVRAVDLRERGQTVDLDDLCCDRPDLVGLVRQAIAAHDRVSGAFPLPADGETDPMLGRLLGERYRVVRRVGMGAMGTVFAAFDPNLGRHVAIKVVEPYVLQDPERRARFRREAQAVAALRHPGIVAVHDHGDGELPFLVMDLVPGLDLEQLLEWRTPHASGDAAAAPLLAAFAAAAAREAEHHPATFAPQDFLPDALFWRQPWPAVAARIALGIAQALAHAHSHGVLHRDVKPGNVRVKPDGSVVLLDFGLARLPEQGSLTREGALLGTLAYMAPEQVRGDPSAMSPRSDVYGLGATLYRLLTDTTPFLGEPAALMKQVLWDDPPPVRRRAPGVPRDLAAICHKAIEKRPADRYGSAAEMAADLAAFLDFRPVVAAAPSAFTRVWRRVRRRPERASAIALLTISLPLALWIGRRAAQAAERTRRDANAARCAVPALVTIEGFNPAYSIGELRHPNADGVGAALQRLSRVLSADPDDVEALVLRAMLYLDSGRGPDGVADLRSLLAGRAGSPMAAEVLRRLATGTPWLAADWRTRLLEGLPAPATAFDCYLRAYLELRAGRYGSCLDDLERALELDASFVPSWHLLPLARLGAGDFVAAAEAARRVEGILGRPTARTQHVLGLELQVAGRLAEAAAACRHSLELCPDQYGPLQNLAGCLHKLGLYADARAVVERALAVRPDAIPSWRTRLQILRDEGNTEEIQALVARFRTPDGGPWWLALELGTMALTKAIRQLASEPEDFARQCAEAAELLGTALAGMDRQTMARELAQAQTLRKIAAQLQAGDLARASGQLLLALGDRAPDPGILRDAALLRLRAGGDDGAGEFLLRQARRLAPQDPLTGEVFIEVMLEAGQHLAATQAWRDCFAAHQSARAADLRARILAAASAGPGRGATDDLVKLLAEPASAGGSPDAVPVRAR